jgi:integrase
MLRMAIKNVNYRNFLDQGIIETLNEKQLCMALDKIRGKRCRYIKEARVFLILLYYSGARPNEILNLKAKNASNDGVYLKVLVPGSKKGLPRSLYFQLKKPLVKECLEYCLSCMPDAFLFYHYRSGYTRKVTNRKGEVKYRLEVSNGLRWYFQVWWDNVVAGGIPPYFLRHNRMSKLAEKGASLNELRMLKGSRTYESVMPYLHMSSRTGKTLAKKID